MEVTAIYAKNTGRNQLSRRNERAGEKILIQGMNTASRMWSSTDEPDQPII